MNVLVVGLGALGTVYACLLKSQGHRVTALVKDRIAEEIKNQGITVSGIWGNHSAGLDQVAININDLANQHFDIILLTVKSYATKEVIQQIKCLIKPNTYLFLLQNGYGNFEIAAELVPEEQVVLCRVIFGAETIRPGQSKVTVIADDVILGSPKQLIPDHVLLDFAKIFSKAGIPTKFSSDVMKYLWGKILYNSALNPLGAIFAVNYGMLTESKSSRLLLEKIIREIFQLMEVSGHQTLWPNAEIYLKDFYGKMIPTTAAHHASMLQDIQLGRKTEIDALNGAMVELGKEYNLSMPVNEMLTLMIKAKEQLGSLPKALYPQQNKLY